MGILPRGLCAGVSHDYIHQSETKTCFENDGLRDPEPPGVIWIKVDVSGHRYDAFHRVTSLTARSLLAKKQRVADGAKILLDVAKESADWFPPLKAALGGVNALIRHYEVLVEWMAGMHG